MMQMEAEGGVQNVEEDVKDGEAAEGVHPGWECGLNNLDNWNLENLGKLEKREERENDKKVDVALLCCVVLYCAVRCVVLLCVCYCFCLSWVAKLIIIIILGFWGICLRPQNLLQTA